MPNQFSNGGRDEAIVPFGTREMERPYDRKLDGRYDPDEAMRYRIVNGERICGWSCDPMSPYYKEDHHMCPAECHGNVYVPRTGRKKKFERIVDVCGGDAGAPALPEAGEAGGATQIRKECPQGALGPAASADGSRAPAVEGQGGVRQVADNGCAMLTTRGGAIAREAQENIARRRARL